VEKRLEVISEKQMKNRSRSRNEDLMSAPDMKAKPIKDDEVDRWLIEGTGS